MNDYRLIPVDEIRPNPQQPRKAFDEARLGELADSIEEHGVITPIEVEQNGTGYILHAGERRWRAAQMAGLREIPAVVTGEMDERTRLERALVENIQRQDMNPIEEALAYRRLYDEFGLSMQAIARRVGRAQYTIKNRLDWLAFEGEIRDLVAAGQLHSSHRVQQALEQVPDRVRVKFARRMADGGFTISGIEKAAQVMASAANRPDDRKKRGRPAVTHDRRNKRSRDEGPGRAHAVRLLLEEGQPVPGPCGPQLEAGALKACEACAMFPYPPGKVCEECPATVMLRAYMEVAGE